MKKAKEFLYLLLSILMVLSLLSVNAWATEEDAFAVEAENSEWPFDEAEEDVAPFDGPAEEELALAEEAEEEVVIKADSLGSGVCGEGLRWDLSDDGVLTISGTGEMAMYSSGASPWYSLRRKIFSLVIENGVTSIGNCAFYCCEDIKNMSIPDSVTKIGEFAFFYCSALENISIPDSVTDIEQNAFASCHDLKSISLSKNLDFISNNMFMDCRSLTSLTIPDSVTGISTNAFNGCALTELTIPAKCEYVANAFMNSPLTSVTFKGPPPRFDNGTFFGMTLTAYYPADDDSWTEEVRQNYYGTITWIGKVPVPAGRTLTYTGKKQTGVDSGTYYTLSGNTETNADSYKAVAVLTDKDNYAWSDGTTEDKSISWKIKAKKITPTVKLSASSFTWNGKAKKPSVTVKNGSKALKASNYTVRFGKNKNVGIATVTVKMKGNYSGSKTVTFKINPKGTSLKNLTAASKAITVKWTKQATKMSSSRITGYQIQLATDSKFTKNKKMVTVSGYSRVFKKVTGLKGGKKYYVRIRTYKMIDGKKYCSSWSKVKTITTKK